MGDLIIKPADEGHLKLQNDAGTTILEMVDDESKLRLTQNNISASDGTTAITTSGANVTLAGTSNNIGTVTSGTISSATFPAGHIIQVHFRGFDADQSIGDGSSSGKEFVTVGAGVTGEEFSISMAVSSGNKIVGFGNVNLVSTHRYGALKVYMDSTQIASGTETGSERTNVTVSSTNNPEITHDEYMMKNSSFSFNYTPSDTSSHTYTVKAGNTSDNAAYTIINRPENNDNGDHVHRGYSSFILMEVQQ